MTRYLKNIVGMITFIILIHCLSAWVAGDNFEIIGNGFKGKTKGQIEAISLDSHKLGLERARKRVNEVREGVVELKASHVKAEAGLRSVAKDILVAQRQIDDQKAYIVSLKRRIEAGLPVYTASTHRELSFEEQQLCIQAWQDRVRICEDKIAFLHEMRDHRNTCMQNLEQLVRRAPLELDRCEMSVEFFAQKVWFYEVCLCYLEVEKFDQDKFTNLFEKVQRDLERVYTEFLDSKIAQLEATYLIDWRDPIVPEEGSNVTSEDLLGDIQEILTEDEPLDLSETGV